MLYYTRINMQVSVGFFKFYFKRDRQTDRDRETDKQSDIDRQTDRQRETDRQTEAEAETETESDRERHTHKQRGRQTDRDREAETDKATKREEGRQTETESTLRGSYTQTAYDNVKREAAEHKTQKFISSREAAVTLAMSAPHPHGNQDQDQTSEALDADPLNYDQLSACVSIICLMLHQPHDRVDRKQQRNHHSDSVSFPAPP